ncbi:MAG: class I SAM-dependent methyltransferase [Microthrixaceae bacterium]
MEADEYERIADAEDEHWWYRYHRSLVHDLLAPAHTGTPSILDVGCGPGGGTTSLAALGNVVGLDPSPDALSLLRRRDPSVRATRGRVEQLPFADASFDVVTCVDVLYTVGPHTRAIEEMGRVLAPGGTLVVVEPAFELLRRAHDAQVHGRRRFRRRELSSLLERGGFDVDRCTYACSFLTAPAAALALWERMRPTPQRPRSDVDRRGLDPVLAPLAEGERRWLRDHDLPFGTSAIVTATRMGGRPGTGRRPIHGWGRLRRR